MKRAWFVVAVLLFAACKKSEPNPSTNCPACNCETGVPVDPLLLSFLSRARAAHHIADDRESDDNLTASAEPLERLVTGPLPRVGSADLAPEVREVLADTYARLADLHSRQGAFDRALQDVQQGLEHARDPNYFRGHLLETEGLVEERHAKALEKNGDHAGAAVIRKRAIELLEHAMEVQSGVIEHAPHAPSDGNGTATPTPAASTK
ncbi:MAG TPA: hypothetical protein VER96_01520 [Polyangiaceae bacterium]|nr:hypothetical protein [Polyangiaceae bacterium]